VSTAPGAPVGASLPRDRARRLLVGRGRYVDDLTLPRMLHVAFVRSPHPHARIGAIDREQASRMPGVVRVVTGAELAAVVASWRGEHRLFPALRAPEQHAMAVDTARFQGEAVAAVLASTRASAEDAAEAVVVAWQELPAVVDAAAALQPDSPVIHDELGDNLAFHADIAHGDAAATLDAAHLVVERRFRFNRHTGLSLEPRGILAAYDPAADSLLVHQSHQTPHQQQDLFARLLGIPEQRVRVVCEDVGGAFGLKHHLYADEMAACALAKLTGRPVKFIADRLESFLADIHCRDHHVHARMGFGADGEILAIEVEDLFAAGAYSQYPRSSIAEGNQIIRLCGAPYRHRHYRAAVRMAWLNKGILGHVRSVGHPIACAVTECLLESGARALGIDASAVRRRNYLRESDEPYASPGGIELQDLSLHRCLDRALEKVDLDAFRGEQAALRERGVYRGIGFATVIELSAIGPEYYGEGGQHISARETCLLRLEGSGTVRCFTGATDQGQGIDTGIQQVVAAALGVAAEQVAVISGDSEACPVGGGSWASRGAALAGEAALRAGRTLRGNVLEIAGALLQTPADALDLRDSEVVDAASGEVRMSLAEVAAIGHFRPYALPEGVEPRLTVSEPYSPRGRLFLPGNGLHVVILDVDLELGTIALHRHLVVHDCGRMINPLLVREQMRGGAVQGLGGALYEELRYDEAGRLQTGTLADYLAPMAVEMPDFEVEHVETPARSAELGAKGAGETGTAGVMAAVMNAVNDALATLGVEIHETPVDPPRLLAAIAARRD
jgi:carbon-monoxide dehydrogenase large subunit